MKRFLLAVCALGLLAPTAMGGAQPQAVPAEGPDQVVVAISLEPLNLNPTFIPGFDVGGANIAPALFANDVELDASWRPFPQGVEYLPSIKDGTLSVEGDRMSLLWRLRPRNWHDGRPVACGDYVFAFRVVRDPRALSTVTAAWESIAGVSCPTGAGGRDVRVDWRRRSAFANMDVVPTGPIPRHIIEPIYRRTPARIKEIFGIDPGMTTGDGAYRLVEWRRGESLTLEAVSNHPIFGTPRIKRITYRFVQSLQTRTAALLAGTIDALGSVGSTIESTLALERLGAGRIRILFSPPSVWEHIDFNLDNPFLQDIRVRRAIAHGINRTQIAQELFQGRQPAAHTYLPPRHPGYTDTLPRYPYDPSRARALLREAGFALGPDGVMRTAAGQRLTLDLTTRDDSAVRRQVQEIIRQQLRQVGIEINIVNFPSRVFFDELLQRRRFTGMAMYALIWYPVSGCDNLYTSDGIPTAGNGWRGDNYAGYKSQEMDDACKGAARELDPALRNRLLQKSSRIFSRDLPSLPLYYRTDQVAFKAGLQNFTPRGISGETWNAHTWHWK